MDERARNIAAGALGGFVGGVVVSLLIEAAVASRIDPASDMVQMQRRAQTRARLGYHPPRTRSTPGEEAVGVAWHIALSAGVGALYGACRRRLDARPVEAGLALGATFYPLAFWVLGPATGLTEKPWREKRDLLVRRPLVHLVFGVTTALTAAQAVRRF